MALRDFSHKIKLPMPIWDLPTRIFHWMLVVLISLSYVSIRMSWMETHLISGYCMLTLLIFRVVWGFVGSDTARFAYFLRSPLAGLRHLARFRDPVPDVQVGHNEAGGWMVVVMLLLLAVQVGTGLCANDDGATVGPLAKYVGKVNSDWLSGVHNKNFTLVEIAIALHVVAIFAYALVKRHDLVRPMITGKKRLPAATRAPRMVSPILALVVLAVSGIVVLILATRV